MTLSPGNIQDQTYRQLADHYSESQIVEITAIAALYKNMINRFNEALKLDPEASFGRRITRLRTRGCAIARTTRSGQHEGHLGAAL